MAPILLERPSPQISQAPIKSPKCPRSICSCKDVVELDLGHCWSRPQETLAPASILGTHLLTAAWILTLRSFRPEDATTLSYEDDLTPRFEFPTTFTVRVDPDWDVRTLLETLEIQKTGKLSSLFASDGALISQPGHSATACTSSLIYTTTPGLCLARSSIGSEDVKLAIIQHDDRIVARIKSSQTGGSSLNTSMLWTFQHVLRQLTANSATLKLDEIDYCSDFHRQILKGLTHTKSTGSFHCLHDLIVENCRRHPTKFAVRSFDGDLTYQELDDLSLRLAHHLTRLGVRPESFVLSSFQKSTWAIVARLAILRAGGAYISIHSSNPPAYLDSVIQRTSANIMLSDPAYADHFRDKIDTVVTITPEWLETLPLEPESGSLPVVDPSNACTVLFTSGSTGKPKAIVQEHKSYASAIHDYARNLGLSQDIRFLHFDDYAFDISNLEFLVPLILGGCCCVPGPMKSVQDLADNIQSLNANIAFLTPTVAIKAHPQAMSSLKILCVGGEPLPKDLLNNWAESSTKLVNQYGMGEAAVCCAYNDNVHATSSAPATIGQPSSGAIWLIDPTCPEKLVPVGAIGEVVIEGPHLARGYLDQNHQASDRTKPAGFLGSIPRWLTELHPDRQSARLYRSGDLARYTQDGLIEYIGRKDTIVKLDGCRIDVVEVEHLARKCLTPKDAIVVDLLGVIDGKQGPCLAAFLYLSDHPDSSETEDLSLKDASQDQRALQKVDQIRESLAVFLPTYMIPSLFLLGTRVPRTPSKKTDRRMIRLVSHQFYSQMCEERSSSSSEDSDLLPP